MTSLSYEDIFSDFLGNVTDYNIAAMDTNEAYELMSEYLHKALSISYVRRLFKSIEFDDDILEMKYELFNSIDESSDLDFIKNIIAKGMVIEWVKPQVRSKLNIAQMFGGKEQKFYAQANHLSELRSLLEDTEIELRKEIRDRGYIYNPYLK